jgi:YbbR domain-containing protein
MKSRIFDTNLIYKIVAVILSMALWVGISFAGNPMEQRIVLVPIEYINLPQDHMIASQEDTVNVRIEGRTEDLEFIYAEDIVGTVDLSDSTIGISTLDVTVIVPDTVALVEVKPTKVDISIAEIMSVQLPVVASVTGYPREGYNTLSAVLTPTEVLVEGPQEWLDVIDRVLVNIILNYETSYNKMLPIRVLDEQGNEITDKVRIVPNVIQVELPIYSEQQTLIKPVHVPLIGEPEEGYKLVGIEVTPDEVLINGDFENFRNIIYYDTEPVDITGATKTFSTSALIINDNEFVQLEPEEVLVVVKIERE